MPQFYITRSSDNAIFALDATKDICYTSEGDASDSPLESGESAQDNYVNKNDCVSFDGVISSIKSIGNATNKSPDEYIDALFAIKKSRAPFSVTWHPGRKLENCVFTHLTIKQDEKNGVDPSTGFKSLRVCFTAKALRFVRKAKVTSVPQALFADAMGPKTTGTAATFDTESSELARTNTIIANLKEQNLLKNLSEQ